MQRSWRKNKKAKKKAKKKRQRYDETDYEFSDGLRHVKPYVYEFRTHAKERWYGKSISEVLRTEFGGNGPDYFDRAIADGRITLGGKRVTGCQIMKRGDCLVHKVHRHEPPVTAKPVMSAYEDESVVIVSKPPSIPVHPSGKQHWQP